jgi:hypothetical protein
MKIRRANHFADGIPAVREKFRKEQKGRPTPPIGTNKSSLIVI